MVLPAGIEMVQITGSLFVAGNPAKGKLKFRQSGRVQYVNENVISLAAPWVTTLVDGSIQNTFELPANDVGNPQTTYKVTQMISGVPNVSYDISVLASNGSVQDLSSLLPVDAGSGAGVVVGPAGKSAYEIAKTAGFIGTEAEWLASLIGTSTTDINEVIAALVSSAPETLNTLGEIAAALQTGDSVTTALLAQVDGKLDKTEADATYTTPLSVAEQIEISAGISIPTPSTDGEVLTFNQATGQIVWQQPVYIPPPITNNDTIIDFSTMANIDPYDGVPGLFEKWVSGNAANVFGGKLLGPVDYNSNFILTTPSNMDNLFRFAIKVTASASGERYDVMYVADDALLISINSDSMYVNTNTRPGGEYSQLSLFSEPNPAWWHIGVEYILDVERLISGLIRVRIIVANVDVFDMTFDHAGGAVVMTSLITLANNSIANPNMYGISSVTIYDKN